MNSEIDRFACLRQRLEALSNRFQVQEAAGLIHDLDEYHLQLSQKIQELEAHQRQYQRVTTQLQSTNQEMESFVYSVSHDLRAPIRAISSFVKIVLEKYGSSLDAEALHLHGIIQSEARRMGELLEALMRLARLGQQALIINSINMVEMVQAIFHELQTIAPRENIIFRLNDLPPAPGDPGMIQQVWTNLLANALKFTRPQKNPQIVVDGWREEGNNVYSVRDNGVGFDMRQQERLFLVFQRLHRQEEFEGTGVGLALVQRIVSRHGGKVWAEGKAGQGAAFYFSLPRREP